MKQAAQPTYNLACIKEGDQNLDADASLPSTPQLCHVDVAACLPALLPAHAYWGWAGSSQK